MASQSDKARAKEQLGLRDKLKQRLAALEKLNVHLQAELEAQRPPPQSGLAESYRQGEI